MRTGSSAARAWPLAWLLYLFALALIAPLLGFGMLAIHRMAVAERAAEEEQLRRGAFMLSAVVDRELAERIEMLEALARSGKLKDGDFGGFHRDASAVVRGVGEAIVLIDRNLDQLVNTRVPYGTPLPQTGDPDTARKVFAGGKPATGDLFVGPLLHQFRISIMAPVVIDDAVHYALVLSLDPVALSLLLQQQYLPEGWVARISDRNDRILAHSKHRHELSGKPGETKVKSGRSGVFTTKDRAGNPILIAAVRSDVSGWQTAVWVPLAVLEAPARQLWQALAALAVLASAVSLLAAAFLGRWLARPITGVANAAAALGRGDPVSYKPGGIAEVNVVGANLAAAAEQRRQAEEHLRFLMRELSHRTKNVMAVVQAISWQTAKKSQDLQDFEERFTQRLEALARSQDLLVRRDWRGVDLEDLVHAQLEPFLDSAMDRLTVTGPPLVLRPPVAQELGLALHELATNASKYGALSAPEGKLEVDWKIDTETTGVRRIHMTWRESGGPVVNPPRREGFGYTVTTSSLSRSLKGEATVHYRPEGVSWELTAPIDHLIAQSNL